MSYEQNKTSDAIRFGPYRLDRTRFQLTRNGQRIELQRISMEVLLLLVERPGVLVTRSQLIHAVWRSIDPEEKEQGLNTAINRIRAALRDDPAKPRYIETVIGKGYRFIAAWSPLAADVTISETPSSPVAPLSPSPIVFSVPLEEFQHSPPQPAPPLTGTSKDSPPLELVPPAHHRRSWWLPVVSIIGLVCLAALAYSRSGFSKGHLRAPGSFALATPVQLTANFNDNQVRTAEISPDGAYVAYADAEGVKVVGRSDLTPVKLAPMPLRYIEHISWFTGGDRLLISGTGQSSGIPEVWIASRSGAMTSHLFRSNAHAASVSHDGSRILFLADGRHELWECAPDGSASKILLSGNVGEEFFEPTWFPDGKLILLQRRSQPTEKARLLNPGDAKDNSLASSLVLRQVDGVIVATQSPLLIFFPSIFPDGTVLFVADTRIFDKPLATMGIDLHTGRFTTPPTPVDSPPGYNLGPVSVAANGEIAMILQGGQASVFVANLTNSGRTLGAAQPLGSSLHATYPHSWSPDSRAVFFEQYLKGKWLLMKQNIGQRDTEPLVGTPVEGVMVRLSPDRRWLLFYHRLKESDPLQLYRLPYGALATVDAGPPQAQLLPVPPGDLRCPEVGGQCILRIKDADRRQVVLLALDPTTGQTQPQRILPWADASFGDWDVSPDGTEVVFVAGQNQPGELRVLSIHTTRERILNFPVAAPFQAVNWQSSGKGWFASVSAGAGAILYSLEASGRATPLRDTFTSTWAVPSPDGKSLAYVDLNQDRNVWLTRRELMQATSTAP